MERRRESRKYDGATEPGLEALDLPLDGAPPVGPEVAERLPDDLAVGALGPTADDPTVPPHRRPGVAGAVEQRRLVRAEVPPPLGPAHDGRVEAGQQRRPRLRRPHGRVVAGEHEPGLAVVELDLDGVELGDGGAGLAQRPARPPLQIRDRAGTGRRQPAPREPGPPLVPLPGPPAPPRA